ncbi:hypothetical protein PCANC_04401 [Puccinia coronata f. sp. avenae]|uniref:Uncharacterized protein n=1 Tax=Puccinia coronata f. sp. avenae TaxID=200324 RepID=A0A2N5T924_9BASI|nr:hypothetical protein PCANC_04401 [Puccinia coronata f. sp. avenae]
MLLQSILALWFISIPAQSHLTLTSVTEVEKGEAGRSLTPLEALTEKSAFTEKPIVHSNKGSLEGADNVPLLIKGREDCFSMIPIIQYLSQH